MEFTSIHFLLFVTATVLAYHVNENRSYRLVVLTIANGVFIASYLGDLREAVPLFAYLVLAYIGIELIRRFHSLLVLAITLCLIVALFVFLKRYSFLTRIYVLPFFYLTLGLSYVLFRVLHLMIDARDGEIPEQIGLLTFFNYTCNFLCFVSGPIQRYQDFLASSNKTYSELSPAAAFLGVRRIISGYMKFIVISGGANSVFTRLSGLLFSLSPHQHTVVIFVFAATALSYTVYLYYNFSGYMDIILGLGMLLSLELPENFNEPFRARDFLEFWTRWHITLSLWFKTYLFNPLMSALLRSNKRPTMIPYLGVLAYFVTFTVMGLWHGTTAMFSIYGLVMGAGASVVKLWQLVFIRCIGRRRYRALGNIKTYEYCCRGLTCAYYTLGITFFWINAQQLGSLWDPLGLYGVVAGLLVLALGCAFGMLTWDFAIAPTAKWAGSTRLKHGVIGNFWAGGEILIILSVFAFFHKAPEFVYRAF